jgi:hypothetical protein
MPIGIITGTTGTIITGTRIITGIRIIIITIIIGTRTTGIAGGGNRRQALASSLPKSVGPGSAAGAISVFKDFLGVVVTRAASVSGGIRSPDACA